MSRRIRPFAALTVAATLTACVGEPLPEGAGHATAEIQVVPAGVGCLRLVYRAPGATADTTRNFAVTPGAAASLDLGVLAAGAYAFRPVAYNLACGSVVAASVPTWAGPPVSANIVAGFATSVAIVLRPNVTTTGTVDFVAPASAVFLSQLYDYYGSAQGYAAMQDGSVRAWGTNTYGQLGDGTTTTRLTPVTIPGLRDVRQIAASPFHACALLGDGTIRCWGYNGNGQVGDGSTTSRLTPVAVALPGGARARSIAVGYNHSCAVTATVPSTTYCWGMAANGRLGNNSEVDSTTPVASILDFYPPTGGHDSLVARDRMSCGVHAEGYVSCWGAVPYAALLPYGATTYTRAMASFFPSGQTSVGLGSNFACGLRPNGRVQCVGDNTAGQMGLGLIGSGGMPFAFANVDAVTALQVGDQHACARRSDGSVWCWGQGRNGELGDGNAESSGSPHPVPDLTDVVSLSVGGSSSCAVRTDGTVWCWGYNRYGQLGDGTVSSRFVPTRVAL
jgi:alpha-tubulin suppressor-like RCC1 family protein